MMHLSPGIKPNTQLNSKHLAIKTKDKYNEQPSTKFLNSKRMHNEATRMSQNANTPEPAWSALLRLAVNRGIHPERNSRVHTIEIPRHCEDSVLEVSSPSSG